MPDNKLTDVTENNVGKISDNDIIKALECCSEANNCGQCEYEPTEYQIGTVGCCNELMKDALNLITRLQAEKQNLEVELKAMRGAANSYKAENEKLRKDSKDIDEFARNICKERLLQGKAIADFDSLRKYIKMQKAEAYKECIEKVKEHIDTHEHLTCEECECVPISKNGLDNLLKELVGEK